jgi:hypothetical protein
MSKRCIVPRGFECTAHPVFFRFQEPPPLPIDLPFPFPSHQRHNRRSHNVDEEEEAPEDVQLARQSPNTPSYLAATTTTIDTDVSRQQQECRHRPGQTQPSERKEGEEERLDTTCPICLSKFLHPVTLVACAHQFCMDCILNWFNRTVTCPLCKSDGNCFVRSIQGVGLKMFAAVKGDSARAVPGADELAKAVNVHRRLMQQLTARKRPQRSKQSRSCAHTTVAEPVKKVRMTLEEELDDVQKQLAEAERELAELDAATSSPT